MGTEVHSKNCMLAGYYSMRNLNDDSSSYGWPLYYGDKSWTNRQYCNGYSARATIDTSGRCDKDSVKQTMLEHEAIFKKQVYELHRLYRIQRDLMEETKRKELHTNQYIEGNSFSPRPSTNQILINDWQRWYVPGFLADSFSARSLDPGVGSNHSPLLSVKEDNRKDIDVMESRTSKVRRKIFDLQLPADDYVDSDESDKFTDEKGSRNCKVGPQLGLKLLDRDVDKERCQEDTSRSEQSMRNYSLADLNEPFGTEETNTSGYIDLLGQSSHPVTNGFLSHPVKTKSQFLCSSKDNLFIAHSGNGYDLQNNQYLGKSGSGTECISHVFEAGLGKSNLQSIFHGSQPGKLSSLPQTMQGLHDKVNDFSSNYKVDLLVNDQELSKSCHETSNKNRHQDSLLSLHRPSTLPAGPSSNLAVAESWSHSVTSWQMPSSSYNQKSRSTQMYSCLNSSKALSTNASLPGHTNGITADALPSNSNSKSNLGFGCEYPIQNGFYHGSLTGSKEVPVLSHDYLKYSDSQGVSKRAVNLDSAGCCKSLNFNVIKLANGFALSNGSSNKLFTEQGPGFIDTVKKQEVPLAVPPCLQTRASYKIGEPLDGRVSTAAELHYVQASSISKKDVTKWGVNGSTSVSCSSDFEGRRTKIGDSSCSKKILGVPIFEKTYTSNNDSSSLTSPLSSKLSEDEVVENKLKIKVLDINLPCDLAVADSGEQTQRERAIELMNSDARDSKFRYQIDLNLSVSEGEEVSVAPTPNGKLKITALIDLETPAVPELDVEIPLASSQSSQQDANQPQDELMMKAAEAIVAITSAVCSNDSDDVVDMTSNQSGTSIKEPLAWFVDIVSSCFESLEEMLDAPLKYKHGQCNEGSSSEEIDVFELMTLRQEDTREEDYMPQPVVLESFKLEELGQSSFCTRARRGPARRGRQRRDFQRDILPGLASLSRHEVTEDLQTFGGLMRATGHSWNLGLTRRSSTRSGCGRGRRRMAASPTPRAAANVPCTPLIKQINSVKVGFEERNLTCWGKTLRRPRRQRCAAAGNPPIPLT